MKFANVKVHTHIYIYSKISILRTWILLHYWIPAPATGESATLLSVDPPASLFFFFGRGGNGGDSLPPKTGGKMPPRVSSSSSSSLAGRSASFLRFNPKVRLEALMRVRTVKQHCKLELKRPNITDLLNRRLFFCLC